MRDVAILAGLRGGVAGGVDTVGFAIVNVVVGDGDAVETGCGVVPDSHHTGPVVPGDIAVINFDGRLKLVGNVGFKSDAALAGVAGGSRQDEILNRDAAGIEDVN